MIWLDYIIVVIFSALIARYSYLIGIEAGSTRERLRWYQVSARVEATCDCVETEIVEEWPQELP